MRRKLTPSEKRDDTKSKTRGDKDYGRYAQVNGQIAAPQAVRCSDPNLAGNQFGQQGVPEACEDIGLD